MSWLPLSPLQRGFLAAGLASEDSGTDVEQLVVRLPGNHAALPWKEAWRETARQFEILRYQLRCDDSGYGWACRKHAEFDCHKETLEGGDWALERWLRADRVRGISLAKGRPLWRVAVFGTETQTVLVWTVHHILVDGRSFLPVLRAVTRRALGKQPDERGSASYREFLRLVSSPPSVEAREWYQAGYSDFEPPALLELPRSGAEKEIDRSGMRTSVQRSLSAERVTHLTSRAEVLGGTLNTLVEAAWSWVLSRLLRSDDVIHGSVRHGRHWGTATPEADVGLFIVNVPVRSQFPVDATGRSLFAEMRRQHIEVRPYEQVGLQRIEEWILGRSGRTFESFVMFENATWKRDPGSALDAFPGASLELLEKTGMPVSVVASATVEGGLDLEIDFDAERFCQSAMDQVLESLLHSMQRLVDQPDAPLAQVAIISPSQRYRFVEKTESSLQPARWPNLVAAFRESALAHPECPALEHNGEIVTYAELDAQTDQAAAGLARQGIGKDDIVGLCFGDRTAYYPAMLAVIKAGAACLPIDVRLGHAKPAVLLSEAGAKAVWTDETNLEVPQSVSLLDDPDPVGDFADLPEPGEIAWVLFTSGSTGTPKGVAVPHLGIANYIQFTGADLGIREDDRISQIGSLGFDVSLEEIWLAWAHGACLLPMPAGLHETPNGFSEWVADQNLSVLDLTTGFWASMGRALANGSARLPVGLRAVIIGGEELKVSDYQQWRKQLGDRADEVRLQNTYGPTEASISVTTQLDHGAVFEDANGHLPIGKVLPNVQVDVIDSYGQMLPQGAIGELLISGVALGPGYLNRKEDKAFDRRQTARGEEWSYATGDLGYIGDASRFYYLGRIDRETKVRGFRFHPGTLETALREQPEVAEAIVHIEKKGDDAKVIAFLVGDDSCTGDDDAAARVREALTDQLPPHQMPHRILFVDQVPLTPNGKVDLRSLEQTFRQSRADSETETDADARPATKFEETILETATKVLGKKELGMGSRFHREGGDSLNALEWFGLLQTRGILVETGFLKEGMTFREFSDSVQAEKARSNEPARGLLPMRVSGDGTPVILPPGAEGNLHYEGWTAQIDSHYDIYGLVGDGPDAEHPSFRSMSDGFADALDELPEDSPPPILLGGCYGGFVVQDVAASLIDRGKPPAAIILVGAHYRARFLKPSSVAETLWQLKSIMAQVFRRPPRETRRHLGLVWLKIREKLVREKRLGEVRNLGGIAEQIAAQEKRREQVNSLLLTQHELRSTREVPAVLVTVGDPRYSLPGDPFDGWGEVLDVAIHHEFPDLDHGALQLPENEPTYARQINTWLAEASPHP